MACVEEEQDDLVDGNKLLQVLRQNFLTIGLLSHFEPNGLMSSKNYALLSNIVHMVEIYEAAVAKALRMSKQQTAASSKLLKLKAEKISVLESLSDHQYALNMLGNDRLKEQNGQSKLSGYKISAADNQWQEIVDNIFKEQMVELQKSLKVAAQREKALVKENEELNCKLKSTEQKIATLEVQANAANRCTLEAEAVHNSEAALSELTSQANINQVMVESIKKVAELRLALDKQKADHAKEREDWTSKLKSSAQKIADLQLEIESTATSEDSKLRHIWHMLDDFEQLQSSLNEASPNASPKEIMALEEPTKLMKRQEQLKMWLKNHSAVQQRGEEKCKCLALTQFGTDALFVEEMPPTKKLRVSLNE